MDAILKFSEYLTESVSTPEKELETIMDLDIDNTSSSPISILIINGCEHGSDIEKKIEEFQSKLGQDCCTVTEIPLYQLNIQNSKKEPKDGMVQIYNALEKANALIIACEVNKGKLSESLETAISRIKNYYKKNELKNKIFGSIILGNDEKIKNDMILTALNDLGMVVSSDCFFSADSNIKTFADTIKSLSNLMIPVSDIETETETEPESENVVVDNEDTEPSENNSDIESIENDLEPSDIEHNDELKDFDEFTKDNESNDISSEDLPTGEDDIKFKSFNEFTDENESSQEEDDEIEEDEERLIDNEDGTITQITKNDPVKESKLLSFDEFMEKFNK